MANYLLPLLVIVSGIINIHTSAVTFWTCPELHIENLVSCSCDVTHTLRCEGQYATNQTNNAKTTSKAIMSVLHTLPSNNAVHLLHMSLPHFDNQFPNDMFVNVTLQGLILSQSSITSLPRNAFRGLESSLAALGMPHNNLSELPVVALSQLTLLEKLDLSNNRITNIKSRDLTALSQLQELNLANNEINSIAEDAFVSNDKLVNLILDGNRLQEDLPIFTGVATNRGLQNLKYLSMAKNGIKDTRRFSVVGYPQLEHLDLSFNNLTAIRLNTFLELSKLQTLDISHNQLTNIEDGAFRSLSKLLRLNLNHNLLTDVDFNTFEGLISLRRLNLNDNYLRVIGGNTIKGLTNLQAISVKDNDITQVYPWSYDSELLLDSFDLEDNPLVCDCRMKEFTSWLHGATQLTIDQKRGMVCDIPQALTGRPVASLQLHELVCANETPEDTLARMEAEEIGHFSDVIETGTELIEYEYRTKDRKLKLDWLIHPSSFPYRCDAVFIFEMHGKVFSIHTKKRITCDSNNSQNPLEVSLQLDDIELEREKLYRFCLVLFSRTTLVPGCSENVNLEHSSNTGHILSIETPHRKTTPMKPTKEQLELANPHLLQIHVNRTTTNSITLWWTLSQENVVPDSCVLNVTVTRHDTTVAQSEVRCLARSIKIGGFDGTKPYTICITSTANTHSSQKQCIDIKELSVTRIESSYDVLVTVIVASIFMSVAITLIIFIVLLAKRMCCPTKTTRGLLNCYGNNVHYRVLFHPKQGSGVQTANTTTRV